MTDLKQDHLHLLVEGAKQLGVQVSPAALAQLTLYLEELLRWSPKIDLVSQTDPAAIIRKHFLDSIAIAPLLPENATLLDLGSGAGFPGIPIAIALPHTAVSLVEARRKRVSFLKEVVRKAKTPNLMVYEGRAEVLAQQQDLLHHFSVVLTRATWHIDTFLHLAHPFLQPTGTALMMKGPQLMKELHEWESSSQKHGFLLQHRYRYVLPGSGEHREVVTFLKEDNVSRDT
jgi:16S rRNA (guanine527-N7)-methyltransferase